MISFVIPAHDEAQLIAATLRALQQAAMGLDCEIIVVDDASTDATADIALRLGARVVPIESRHIAAARNAGAAAATGDLLFFIDADTHVDTTVVQAALKALQQGAAGGGAGVRLLGNRKLHERLAENFFIWAFRLSRIAPGCFVFCTRIAYDAAGGFDEQFYAGEDVAMSRSLARQGRFVILPQVVWTSARKLRTFSPSEHLRLAWNFLRRGRRVLHSREHLGLWYDGRRNDRPD